MTLIRYSEYDYGSQTIHGIPSVKEELKDFAVNNNIR